MKKITVIGLVSAGIILVGSIGSSQQSPNVDSTQPLKNASTTSDAAKKVIPTCDGKVVVAGCVLKGVAYEKYIYHPAVAQKTHTETVTTYEEKTTGYCTLCSDGTYSPTCATGRGACSWHGGVAQWNAPITSRVPIEGIKTVVDAPAKNAYIEKVKE